MLKRTMHVFGRGWAIVLGLPDFRILMRFERGSGGNHRNLGDRSLGASSICVAQLLDINQKIGEPAFDAFEQTQACIRGIEPFDQRRDAILKMRERGVIRVGRAAPIRVSRPARITASQVRGARLGQPRPKR